MGSNAMFAVGETVRCEEWAAIGTVISHSNDDRFCLVDFAEDIGRRWTANEALAAVKISDMPKRRRRKPARNLWRVTLSDNRWATAHTQESCASLVEHVSTHMLSVRWAKVQTPFGQAVLLERLPSGRLPHERVLMIVEKRPVFVDPETAEIIERLRSLSPLYPPKSYAAPSREFPTVIPRPDDRWRDVYDITADNEDDVPPPYYPSTITPLTRRQSLAKGRRVYSLKRVAAGEAFRRQINEAKNMLAAMGARAMLPSDIRRLKMEEVQRSRVRAAMDREQYAEYIDTLKKAALERERIANSREGGEH